MLLCGIVFSGSVMGVFGRLKKVADPKFISGLDALGRV